MSDFAGGTDQARQRQQAEACELLQNHEKQNPIASKSLFFMKFQQLMPKDRRLFSEKQHDEF